MRDFNNDAAQLFQFRHYAGGTFPIIDGDLNVVFKLAHLESDRALDFRRRQSREASLTSPQTSIKCAVLDGFRDVIDLDLASSC